jgi:hypothetical protein
MVVIAVITLAGLSVLASPLFALILVAIFGGLAVVVFVVLRGNREIAKPGAGGGAGPADKSAFRGGPGPMPRDGGAPASGEGAPRGGEAAGTSRSES